MGYLPVYRTVGSSLATSPQGDRRPKALPYALEEPLRLQSRPSSAPPPPTHNQQVSKPKLLVGHHPFPAPRNSQLLTLPPWIQAEHGCWHVGLIQTKTDASGGPRPDTLGPASLSGPPHLPWPTLMCLWFLHLHLHSVTRRSPNTRCASVAPPSGFSCSLCTVCAGHSFPPRRPGSCIAVELSQPLQSLPLTSAESG